MAQAHRSVVKDPAKAFISTWRTSIVYTGSTANNQIKLPLEVAGTYRFTVQWGDGTSNLITTWNQAQTTHTYPAPGDYTVTITGYLKGWDFGGGGAVAPTTGDMRKLLTITQFGCLRLVTHLDFFPAPSPIWGTFYGCTNLTLTGVTDTPNFKGTTSTQGFLRLATSIINIPNINKWDVSKIEIFKNMLREMPLFDGNVGNWNTSSALNFFGLFNGSTVTAPYGSFTNGGSDSIKDWNVSKVTTMLQTFNMQPKFNINIGSWDVSSVSNFQSMFNSFSGASGPYISMFNNGGSSSIGNWNTSSATNMYGMFSGATVFNQNIGNWDVSNVTGMGYMMQSRDFNNGGSPDINNWDVRKVTSMSRLFQNGFSFNQPINNWKVPLVTDFVNFMNESGVSTPYAFSVINYSNFLIALAAQPVKPNISLRVNQYYNSSCLAARAILAAAPNNWTFVDKGLQP